MRPSVPAIRPTVGGSRVGSGRLGRRSYGCCHCDEFGDLRLALGLHRLILPATDFGRDQVHTGPCTGAECSGQQLIGPGRDVGAAVAIEARVSVREGEVFCPSCPRSHAQRTGLVGLSWPA